jgi:hypothetical protein
MTFNQNHKLKGYVGMVKIYNKYILVRKVGHCPGLGPSMLIHKSRDLTLSE